MAEAAADHAGGCRPPGERQIGIAGWSWDTVQEGSKKPGSMAEENTYVRGSPTSVEHLKITK